MNKKKVTKYSLQYFINRFKAIPLKRWAVGSFQDNGKCCALGHLGCEATDSPTYAAKRLKITSGLTLDSIMLLNDELNGSTVFANGSRFTIRRKTPKYRVIAALKAIKKQKAA